MFKRFTVAEDVSTQTAIKSSAIRAIKSTVEGQYPPAAEYIDEVMPKKAVVLEGKGCVLTVVWRGSSAQWEGRWDESGAGRV